MLNILLPLNLMSQRNLARKNRITDLVKKTGSDGKLRRIIIKVTSNKTRHVEAGKKLNDHITFYKKLLNDLLRNVKLILTKESTKDLMNG